MLSPEFVLIRAPSRGLRLVVRLGDGSPRTSGGVGGWESVARPGRRPLVAWRGVQDPLRMHLPILFDGFPDRSVESEVRTLEKMGGLDRGDPEPPLLVIEGALPHDQSRAAQNRWIIEGIEWGDAYRRPDGHRVRQAAEVTLIEHTEDDHLERVRPLRTPRFRYVRARQGDTFERLAARVLGTKRLGARLARLNGKRSPDLRLKAGQRYRVPTGDELRDWKKDLKRRRR